MVGWYNRLDGHEFEQLPGVGDRQGSLRSCSPMGSAAVSLLPSMGSQRVRHD